MRGTSKKHYSVNSVSRLLFVTHDRKKRSPCRSYRVRNGVIEQDGTPREIYEGKNLFVAGFIGEINRFDAIMWNGDEQRRASVEGRVQYIRRISRRTGLQTEHPAATGRSASKINDDNHIEGLIILRARAQYKRYDAGVGG